MLRLFSLMLVLSFALLACSSKPRVQDVRGVWEGEAVSESVALPIRVTFVQVGASLTGVATLAEALEADLTGSVEAQNVTFSFEYNFGSVEGSEELIAKYSFRGSVRDEVLSGTFTVAAEGTGPPATGTFSFQKVP